MKIGQKLLLGAVSLTLVPLAITAGLLWQNATSVADSTISAQTQTQLTSLRDLKAQQIQDELDGRLAALKSLAQNRATIDAMKAFKPAFYNAAKDVPRAAADAQQHRRAMIEYVDAQFGPEFAKRNPAKAPDLTALVDARDPNTVVLQHEYIIANPNKLGEKEKLLAADNRFAYNDVDEGEEPGRSILTKITYTF
jgi:hypothetical protein